MRHSQAAMIGAAVVVAIFSCGASLADAPVPITAVLGLAMLVGLGYVWTQVLLDQRVPSLERVTMATGLTISVPVLGGLALDAAGVPLHRAAWACLFAGVTLAGAGVLVARLLAVRSRMGQPMASDERPKRWPLSLRKTMACGTAVAIAIGAVGLARVGAAIQHYPGFTELWLSARTENPTTASLGVSNHEGNTRRYKIVMLHKKQISAVWQLTLSNGQTWQRTVSIGGKYVKIVDLYLLPDLTHPYRHVDTGPS
jgi:hypothetical protein